MKKKSVSASSLGLVQIGYILKIQMKASILKKVVLRNPQSFESIHLSIHMCA